MILFPAIDILDGRAVRLLYGKRDLVTDYGDPVDRAKAWVDMGAEVLHVVDLSGAFDGKSAINRTLEKIARLQVPVQTGGGLRSMQEIDDRICSGASRVVLGTVCVTNPQLFKQAVEKYGDKIVAGIDAKDGKIAVKGWTEKSQIDAFAFGKEAFSLGVKDAVFTDISKDGALSGVNVDATLSMAKTGLNVIASGGIRDMDDLYRLKEKGCYGAILGRSIYTGAIALDRAIEEMKC